MPKLRITAQVLRPPQEPITFLLPVEADVTFGKVWDIIERRYAENYARGRESNYIFKKIQDSNGADIDLRDTVDDIFGDIEDPSQRIVQVLEQPIERDNTVPVNSYLRPPPAPFSPSQLDEIAKRRSEVARYGATVDSLDPDHPVESHEPRPMPKTDKDGFAIPTKPQAFQAQLERDSDGFAMSKSQPKKDKDGFAIPAKVNAPRPSQLSSTPHTTQSSQDGSQDTYEDLLVNSQLRGSVELGSPLRAPAPEPPAQTPRNFSQTSQYSSLGAVPSAQKPPATRPHAPAAVAPAAPTTEDDMDIDDSISDDEQPRLSNSAVHESATNEEVNKVSKKWSPTETQLMQRLLDQGHDATHELHLKHFPTRTWDGFRKKVVSLRRSSGSAVKTPQSAKPSQSTQVSHSAKAPQSAKTPQPAITPQSAKAPGNVRQPQSAKSLENSKPPQSTRASQSAKAPQKPVQSSSKTASTIPTWTDDEEAYFVQAIRKDQSWKTLRDHRFRHKSDDSVKVHYAEVRQRLEKEDEARSSQERFSNQVQKGLPSTGPTERFRQDEDDFLMACRLENLDMKGVAKAHFPLRPADQVVKHATSLINDAKRKAEKAGGTNPELERSPSIEFLFHHDAAARDRIEEQRVHARTLKRKLSRDRTTEFESSSQAKTRVAKDKTRAEERRGKEQEQVKYLGVISNAKSEANSVKRRRLEDDLQRESAYKTELAAWEKQSVLDRKAGRSTKPRPAPPLGSAIGTEVSISDSTPSRAAAKNTTATPASQKSNQPSAKPAASSQKRKASNVEVQVVIPAAANKKQKTDHGSKATSNSKAKVVPSNTQSGKKLPAQTTADDDDDDEPIVTFHFSPANQNGKKSATQPAIGGAVKHKTHGAQAQSSPNVPNVRKHPSSMPFLKTGHSTKSTPRGTGMIDDSMFISSDSESSYEDEDITDEELTALAERSEAMYSSSPAKGEAPVSVVLPEKASVSQLVEDFHVMRSSPPVAPLPTPKVAATLKPTRKLQAKKKEAAEMLDQIVAGQQPPISPSARPTSTPDTRSLAAEEQLRQELVRSTQPESESIPGNLPVDETVMDTQDAGQSQTHAAGIDSKDVESIQAWRSQTGDSDIDGDDLLPSGSPNMPFLKKKELKFGPFKYTPTTRTPVVPPAKPEGSSGKQPTNAPQASDSRAGVTPRSPSISNMKPPFPSSGKVRSPSPVVRSADGPFTSPTARSSDSLLSSDDKKSEKINRRKRRSGILQDAHLFAPPPSTAPPDLLSGGGLRKRKQPVVIEKEPATAEIPSSNSKTPKKIAKLASTPSSAVQRSEKGVDTPAKKGKTPVKPKSVPTSTPASKKAIPARNSAVREADRRLHEAATMSPEKFWQEDNLQSMNEEQVLAQMIEQSTQARLQELRAAEASAPKARKVVDVTDQKTIAGAKQANGAGLIAATQPVQAKANWSNSSSHGSSHQKQRPASQPVRKNAKDSSSSSSSDSDSEIEPDVEAKSKEEDQGQQSGTGIDVQPTTSQYTSLTQAELLDLQLEQQQSQKARVTRKKDDSSSDSSSSSDDDSSDEEDPIKSMEKLAALAKADAERRMSGTRYGGGYY